MIHLVPLILTMIVTVWIYRRYVMSRLVQKQNHGLELARHLSEIFIKIQKHKSLVELFIDHREMYNGSLLHLQNEIQANLTDIHQQITRSQELQSYQENHKKIKKLWQQIQYRLHHDLNKDANNFLHAQLTSQIRKAITDLLESPTLYWTEPSPILKVILLDLPSLGIYLTQARDAVSNTTQLDKLPPYSKDQLLFIAEKINYKINKIAAIEKETGLALGQLVGQQTYHDYLASSHKLSNLLSLNDNKVTKLDGKMISDLADLTAQNVMKSVKVGVLNLENAIADGYPQLVTNSYFRPFELKPNLAKCNAYAVKHD